MKLKTYLILLLFVIMGAGARTMFQIAYNGATREHEFGPDKETSILIGLAIWFVVMMIADVILITSRNPPRRSIWAVVLSVAVFAPIVYMIVMKGKVG